MDDTPTAVGHHGLDARVMKITQTPSSQIGSSSIRNNYGTTFCPFIAPINFSLLNTGRNKNTEGHLQPSNISVLITILNC